MGPAGDDFLGKKIMGLDPGLSCTGWGLVLHHGHHTEPVAYGTIRPPGHLGIPQKLSFLYHHLRELVGVHQPHQAAVEKIFLNTNPASTLTLGLARGVVVMTPASLEIAVAEYPATTIKKSVTGNGHASKHQVSHMVARILGLSQAPPADAADALAIALCCIYHRGMT